MIYPDVLYSKAIDFSTGAMARAILTRVALNPNEMLPDTGKTPNRLVIPELVRSEWSYGVGTEEYLIRAIYLDVAAVTVNHLVPYACTCTSKLKLTKKPQNLHRLLKH
ncbi:hypothetical protein BX616_002059, partial [Lobosporangium transversale]